jgi:hypothetical protein
MPQTLKWLNIFILGGEAKLHSGLYENRIAIILTLQDVID